MAMKKTPRSWRLAGLVKVSSSFLSYLQERKMAIPVKTRMERLMFVLEKAIIQVLRNRYFMQM